MEIKVIQTGNGARQDSLSVDQNLTNLATGLAKGIGSIMTAKDIGKMVSPNLSYTLKSVGASLSSGNVKWAIEDLKSIPKEKLANASVEDKRQIKAILDGVYSTIKGLDAELISLNNNIMTESISYVQTPSSRKKKVVLEAKKEKIENYKAELIEVISILNPPEAKIKPISSGTDSNGWYNFNPTNDSGPDHNTYWG